MKPTDFDIMVCPAHGNGSVDKWRCVVQRGETIHDSRLDLGNPRERAGFIRELAAKLDKELDDLLFLDSAILQRLDVVLDARDNQAKQEVYGETASDVPAITYRQVEVGTTVKATDKGQPNYGEVKADNGSSCTVFFKTEDRQHTATKEIAKEHLFLMDGTPLAKTIGQWHKAPTIGELVRGYPKLRKPVIRGLLRIGETMGIVAPPKRGKSWLATQMAVQKVTGLDFLGKFATEPGRVLILDNELHEETSADRVPRVCDSLGIPFSSVQDLLHVENLRGMGLDINTLGDYLEQYEPGEFDLILLDALYRFLPPGVDENSNSQMTGVFNRIDQYAKRLNCGFGAVHHASKGNQSAKGVTDVGSGAGAQSRAVDCHLVLRDHAETDLVVLEAAARSWAPVEPIVLRWEFPSWTVADGEDPTRLRTEKPTAASRLETVKDEVLKSLVHYPDGASKRGIQSYTGRPSCWERALRELIDSGQITECEIKNPTNGKLDTGYQRVYDDGEF